MSRDSEGKGRSFSLTDGTLTLTTVVSIITAIVMAILFLDGRVRSTSAEGIEHHVESSLVVAHPEAATAESVEDVVEDVTTLQVEVKEVRTAQAAMHLELREEFAAIRAATRAPPAPEREPIVVPSEDATPSP